MKMQTLGASPFASHNEMLGPKELELPQLSLVVAGEHGPQMAALT